MTKIFTDTSIGLRLMAAGLVPVLAFLYIAGVDVVAAYGTRRDALQVRALGDTTPLIMATIDELQRQRGLTVLALSSKGAADRARAAEQRTRVDRAFGGLKAKVGDLTAEAIGDGALKALRNGLKVEDRLAALRRAEDASAITPAAALAEFTALVDDLAQVVYRVVDSQSHTRIVRDLTALVATIEAKERAGLERATGARGFATPQFPADAYRDYARYSGEQGAYLKVAQNFAASDIRAELAALADGQAGKAVENFRALAQKALLAPEAKPETATQWFETASARIGALGQIEKRVAERLAADAGDIVAAATDRLVALSGLAAALLVLVGGGLALTIRSITRPIAELVADAGRLAGGDTSVAFETAARRDEVGKVAGAVAQFRDNVIEQHRLAEQNALAQRERDERNRTIEEAVESFRVSVDAVLATVSDNSTAMRQTAVTLGALADDAAGEAVSAAAASEQTSANVQTVAAASDELASSILEIGRQVTTATDVVRRAASTTETSATEIEGLAAAAQRIGAVVDLIQAIAEQTNLLALNATIEAARAGEAGRGFAVVACEVKSLAAQTAKATEEISGQIAGIQNSTRNAVTAIEQVGAAMGEIDRVTTAIAGAIEEQGAATREISQNVQMAAQATHTLSGNIATVTDTVEKTNRSAQAVQTASASLSEEAERLAQEVKAFFVKLRTGPLDRRMADDPGYAGPERRRDRQAAESGARRTRAA